ncbi:MAG: LysM peptidoglycan-binding domain-containing protein [Phycisphaerae bacterium]|nr:LysM peptidoglycan-binding domain-containing protein [Phycisphaerae bacterium]
MNLARTKILLLGLLVLCVAFAGVQSGCEKPNGPKHTVAMTSGGDKPIMKDVRTADTYNDSDLPEPVALNPAPVKSSDPAPLVALDNPADDVKFYRIKADDTYWKIAAGQLKNGKRWREIEKLNPGVDRNKLRIGQTIRIPVK